MPRGKDPFWEYFHPEEGKVRCSFCKEIFVGSITRMKIHLAKIVGKDVRPCISVPDGVHEAAKKAMNEMESRKRSKSSDFLRPLSSPSASSSFGSSSTSTYCGPSMVEASQSGGLGTSHQLKIHGLIKKKEKEIADNLLVKAMVANNLPFNLLRSEDFKEALAAVAIVGPGYTPPSSETARVKILAYWKGEAEEYVKTMKASWAHSGCTLMSDSWTDARKRPHLNLLVTCPKGTVFLKSECTVGKKKDGAYIAKFICSGIEEVGPENVVQVISDNASNYGLAGAIIEEKYPHIFKTSCAAHCLDLILEEIDELPHVKPILASARKIAKFCYRYQHVLDLLRSHTNGRELKRPGATRFATQFLCLQSIIKEEQALRFMVAPNQWRALPQSKLDDGIELLTTIQGNEFWEMGKEVLGSVEPLVKVLRIVDGDGSTMGYLYESMDRAKEAIKEFFQGDVEKYSPLWKIIDDRWNKTLHSPLHAVAGFLNPSLFLNRLVKMDKEVKNGFERVLEKMMPGFNARKAFLSELKLYHLLDAKIFSPMAIDSLTLNIEHPRVWWHMWGAEVPTLQQIAIKLHSQPCSASACERNWSAFDAAHTKKRNKLEPKKLHDLVFVRMNLHLSRTSKEKEARDSKPIVIENILAFDDMLEEDVDYESSDDEFDFDDDESIEDEENEATEGNNANLGLDIFDEMMDP